MAEEVDGAGNKKLEDPATVDAETLLQLFLEDFQTWDYSPPDSINSTAFTWITTHKQYPEVETGDDLGVTIPPKVPEEFPSEGYKMMLLLQRNI